MTKITDDTVRQMAKLAHLKLTKDEVKRFEAELESILNYVERLSKVDTKDVTPTAQVTGLKNVTRPDKAESYGVSPEDLLKGAPATENGYIKVQRVL